jgi:hypothetical protein
VKQTSPCKPSTRVTDLCAPAGKALKTQYHARKSGPR